MADRSAQKIAWAVSLLVAVLESGCAVFEPERVIHGRLVNESSGTPLPEIEVSLYRLVRPLWSMQHYRIVESTFTDASGRFEFLFKASGPYEVRWNPEKHLVDHEYSIAEFEGSVTIQVPHNQHGPQKLPWKY